MYTNKRKISIKDKNYENEPSKNSAAVKHNN